MQLNCLEALELLQANNPSGEKLVEVSVDELARTYGGGDVNPEWTPTIFMAGFTFGALIVDTIKN